MEITTRNLDEIRAIANERLAAFEAAGTIEEKTAAAKDLDEAISYYNEVAKDTCFEICRDAENPMHHAILTFFWDGIRVKEDKDENDKVYRSIDDTINPIDLGALHRFMNNKLGANPDWIYTAQKLNFFLTYRAAEDLGAATVQELLDKNPDKFALHKIARSIDLGETPCSNTNLLKTLQRVVTEMLGEGHNVTSHDVQYLLYCYANDNKKSKTSINLANHKTLRNYLKKICYRVLTGNTGYDVNQKEIKKGKKQQ